MILHIVGFRLWGCDLFFSLNTAFNVKCAQSCHVIKIVEETYAFTYCTLNQPSWMCIKSANCLHVEEPWVTYSESKSKKRCVKFGWEVPDTRWWDSTSSLWGGLFFLGLFWQYSDGARSIHRVSFLYTVPFFKYYIVWQANSCLPQIPIILQRSLYFIVTLYNM